MKNYSARLAGGDLRQIREAGEVAASVKSREDFDQLFQCLYHENRVVRMRAADAIEKISVTENDFLQSHKTEILQFIKNEGGIEFKWHLAQLVSRLNLKSRELELAWNILLGWMADQRESRIVRVNALQGLYELSAKDDQKRKSLVRLLPPLMKENIPSLNARIKKLAF